MSKLHEILAIEGDLKSRALKTLGEAASLFKNGAGKLLGQISIYHPVTDDEEQLESKVTNMVTTVDQALALVSADFSGWVDCAIQKEVTNGKTLAKIKINGKNISLPSTALLNLEKKLQALRIVYKAIPINDVTSVWEWDADNECFRSARPEVRRKTKKVMRAFVAYEANENHPAQVNVYHEDILVGRWETIKQSGMITPKDHRQRLERLDELLRQVKQAIRRANDIDVVQIKVGENILAYINGE